MGAGRLHIQRPENMHQVTTCRGRGPIVAAALQTARLFISATVLLLTTGRPAVRSCCRFSNGRSAAECCRLRVERRSNQSNLSCNHALRARNRLRALVVSKVDYCCSVLAGISGTLLQRLQSVMNATARLHGVLGEEVGTHTHTPP